MKLIILKCIVLFAVIVFRGSDAQSESPPTAAADASSDSGLRTNAENIFCRSIIGLNLCTIFKPILDALLGILNTARPSEASST